MSAERYQDLLNGYIDGDLTPGEHDELARLLNQDQSRIATMQRDLHFADLLEQNLNPERSFPAFLDGLETRVRAEQTGEEFIAELLPKLKEVDQRQAGRKIVAFPQPRKARWVAAGMAAAAAVIASALILPKFLNLDGAGSGDPVAIEWEPSQPADQVAGSLTATGDGKLPVLDGETVPEGPVVIGRKLVVVTEESDLRPGQSITVDRVPGESGSRKVASDGIRSYLIQFDATKADGREGEYIEGSIDFGGEVVGIADENLEPVDKIEFDGDGRTLQLKFKTGERTKLGQMRVFVREDPDKPKGTAGTQPDEDTD